MTAAIATRCLVIVRSIRPELFPWPDWILPFLQTDGCIVFFDI
jgi:hypothetical protein